ncbi:hypothetical protein OPV22_007627 [Ensete ventricosum]|uniref:chorismate mutase n=1 Tax=Ensete ventricosum TaxID=4639 RepID=A0AAV8Q937_ENSVE|nr:hypothetical protein OPV22_007627 [Ensete ventricosum]
MLPSTEYPKVLHPVANSITINKKIWEMYFCNLLPRLVKEGSDRHCGSSAVRDTICLQHFQKWILFFAMVMLRFVLKHHLDIIALSKRIHYGKFVAEAKFLESLDVYEHAIRAQGSDQLMRLLTYDESVETLIKQRVKAKAKIFVQEEEGFLSSLLRSMAWSMDEETFSTGNGESNWSETTLSCLSIQLFHDQATSFQPTIIKFMSVNMYQVYSESNKACDRALEMSKFRTALTASATMSDSWEQHLYLDLVGIPFSWAKKARYVALKRRKRCGLDGYSAAFLTSPTYSSWNRTSSEYFILHFLDNG